MTNLPHNARGHETRLSVGLIADGDRLQTLAPVLRSSAVVEVVAQSGMAQSSGLPGVPWVDDWRTLLTRPELHALLVARTTRTDVEIAAAALERGLHVWRLPPLGRSFAEAAEAVGRTKKQPVVYRLASWWEHIAEQAWRDLEWPPDFRALLSDLQVSAPAPNSQSWRARLAETGGGVLVQDAYVALEALLAVRGLPDTVSAAIGKYRGGNDDAARETEDTAIALLRYTDGGTALVRATWGLGAVGLQLVHYGPAHIATLTHDELSLADAGGTIIDRRPFHADYFADDLFVFAQWVHGDARDRAAAALERHLATVAVLETAYLSARTGHPESPRKHYEVQGWPVPK